MNRTIQDNAPEGRVTIVIGNRQAGTTFNVRLAREHTDYFVPLDLSGFTGKDISLAIHGMPAGAICWKEMKCSDSFDTSNTGKYRPVYHQSPTGTKWMDWGKDHYATVTFSNAPEGRCIALGWMSNCMTCSEASSSWTGATAAKRVSVRTFRQ